MMDLYIKKGKCEICGNEEVGVLDMGASYEDSKEIKIFSACKSCTEDLIDKKKETADKLAELLAKEV